MGHCGMGGLLFKSGFMPERCLIHSTCTFLPGAEATTQTFYTSLFSAINPTMAGKAAPPAKSAQPAKSTEPAKPAQPAAPQLSIITSEVWSWDVDKVWVFSHLVSGILADSCSKIKEYIKELVARGKTMDMAADITLVDNEIIQPSYIKSACHSAVRHCTHA